MKFLTNMEKNPCSSDKRIKAYDVEKEKKKQN